MNALPDSVAVFGPGLMGGSLLMALRQRAPHVKLGAWARRDDALARLESLRLIDFGGVDAAQVAAGADLIVLCLPVDRLAEVGAAIKDAVRPQGVVTDVGSVKQPVVNALEALWPDGRFVGSHPMCGSEEAGIEAARADLYEGAVCVVTRTAESRAEAVAAVESLWRCAGARIVEMDPAEHDRAAALVSHVPHMVAALLVELVGAGQPEFRALCAGGFRDTTRIASGSSDLWAGIFSSNRAVVSAALGDLQDRLAAVRVALDKNDVPALRALLAGAAARRAEILAAS